jgi:ATP-binding cassette, subfamily C, bacterial
MDAPFSLRSILRLMLHHKKALLYGQLITLAIIVISIPIPLLLPMMVNEVLLHKPATIVHTINHFFGAGDAFYYIAIITLLVIFLRLAYFILGVLTTKIFTRISKYVTFMIRKRLIDHLKRTSMNEYETLGSGSITANLITDVNTLDTFLINVAGKLIAAVLTLITVGIVIISINPILGILIIVIQPIIMFISKKMSRHVGSLKKQENEAIEAFQDDISQTLDLFGQIKASNKEDSFFSRAEDKAAAIQKTSNEYGYKSIVYERLSNTIFLVFFELLRASGLLLVAYSDLSIGLMIAMFGYIWFIMTPVQDIFGIQYSYAAAIAAIKRLNKILDLKQETGGKEQLTSHNIEIEIHNLFFAYEGKTPALQDISFNIKHGAKIALIGASGSGKTTLAQIIAGFYDKSGGEILYNCKKVGNIDKHSLRQKIFLILQMPILFNASLRFNITMGAENISDEAIAKALEIAQLPEMSAHLESIVGRHGIKLSGGQRQRLSIARMIIADPSVVIFDESTSALDVQTEAKLYEALLPILKDKTVITIAHRLSTVKNADTIYVLDSGKLVQSGSHETLENEEGHYAEFLKKQLK